LQGTASLPGSAGPRRAPMSDLGKKPAAVEIHGTGRRLCESAICVRKQDPQK
jgi:hypothetical protein